MKQLSPIDMGNLAINNLATPGFDHQAVNKGYADALIRGLDWKASARACPVGNVSLSSPGLTFDGVSLVAGDRVLLKDQTNAAQNGLYTWGGNSVTLVRTPDADSSAEVTSGMAVTVTEGTVNGDKSFNLITDDTINLGVTALTFSALGGASGASYTAGNGLSLAGSDFSVNVGTGLAIVSDNVQIDTAVVPRKYATAVGNGALTTIAVTHNLGTRDVQVSVLLAATPWDSYDVDWSATDANTVTLVFAVAPTSGQYRVVVIG